jgi:hypothetical protein
MEPGKHTEDEDGQANSVRGMIDEAKKLNEHARKSAAGAKFMSDLIAYITAESKRRFGAKDIPPNASGAH